MKIAIIGGGWVGCHLATKLKNEHNITLFEKNDSLFCETSYKNQNRLHYGFHYPRNYKTRILCKDTYHKFINDYGFLVDDVENNLYCIPKTESLIDFETYKDIFREYDYVDSEYKCDKIDGCLRTKEKFINYLRAKQFFNKELKDIIVNKEINIKEIYDEYDLIINATNNNINTIDNTFFELTISLIYEKIKETPFGSLTLMDGLLFSIYPYDNEDRLFTLTDVEHTPIKKFESITELKEYQKTIDLDFVNIIKEKMEKKVNNYFSINDYFHFRDFYLSVKSKVNSKSDDRYPVIEKNGKIVNCFTGKIQGIYIIEDYIKNIL
jgi:hypothetical protein